MDLNHYKLSTSEIYFTIKYNVTKNNETPFSFLPLTFLVITNVNLYERCNKKKNKNKK